MGAAASALGDPARLGGSVRGRSDQQVPQLGVMRSICRRTHTLSRRHSHALNLQTYTHTHLTKRDNEGVKDSEQLPYHFTLDVEARLMCQSDAEHTQAEIVYSKSCTKERMRLRNDAI